jgi:hypothetical protein
MTEPTTTSGGEAQPVGADLKVGTDAKAVVALQNLIMEHCLLQQRLTEMTDSRAKWVRYAMALEERLDILEPKKETSDARKRPD